MKKANLFQVVLTGLVLLLALTGCSVETGTVPSRPPVILGNVTKLDDEAGKVALTKDNMSVFFWTAGLNEDEARAEIRKVNSASVRVDMARVKLKPLTEKVAALTTAFQEKTCLELAAEGGADEIEEVVNVWKELPADHADYERLKECQRTQDERAVAVQKVDELRSEFAEALGEIKTTVGNDWKDVDAGEAGGSYFVIPRALVKSQGPVPVKIQLVNFEFEGNTLSTEASGDLQIRNAAYLFGPRVLVFEFNDNKNKGLVYKFQLERSEDYMGMARFKGDVRLHDASGKIVREGSAQFQGPIVE